VICWVLNAKDMVLAPNQIQASSGNVRHREEVIVIIDQNGGLNEPYILTSRFNCTLEQNKLDEEYIGLYTMGQMIIDPIQGQI